MEYWAGYLANIQRIVVSSYLFIPFSFLCPVIIPLWCWSYLVEKGFSGWIAYPSTFVVFCIGMAMVFYVVEKFWSPIEKRWVEKRERAKENLQNDTIKSLWDWSFGFVWIVSLFGMLWSIIFIRHTYFL